MMRLRPGQINAKMITSYKIFTMPNCCKCADLKEELEKLALTGTIIDAAEDEGVIEIRKTYPKIRDRIKRMESGSFPFPTLLLMDDAGSIVHIVHSADELRQTCGK